MIKKKVCLLGAFAVGKTSLIEQYVNSMFSSKYQTTLGVKIDVKSLEIDQQKLDIVLWDLAGEDEFMSIRTSYLRGSSGLILVADGTRSETLDIAVDIHKRVSHEIGPTSHILIINKSDLSSDWKIDLDKVNELRAGGWNIIETSAKSNHNIEHAFHTLAKAMLDNDRASHE